jgi:heptosyltransferase-2
LTTLSPINFSSEPERVLIVLPTWVGDVVMATPFIKAVFRRFADAKVSLLLYRHLYPVLDGSPWAEHCHFWPRRDKSPESKAAHKALLDALKAERFDLVILLPNSLRVAWLAWRIGAKRRVGFDRDARGLLLTDRFPVPNKTKDGYAPMPLVEYYERLAAEIGCGPSGDAIELHTTPGDDEATSARLRAEGVDDDGPIVVVCPGANFGASKCWHPERFAEVGDYLVAKLGLRVVISPGPGEEPLASRIAECMHEPATLLTEPCLTLGELKSLVKRSGLLLGNDIGPRHIARAFDVPRVTIFGPTEARWTDTSHDKETIVRVDVPCGPCHKKECPLPERVCMDNVTVDMVIAACEHELGATV